MSCAFVHVLCVWMCISVCMYINVYACVCDCVLVCVHACTCVHICMPVSQMIAFIYIYIVHIVCTVDMCGYSTVLVYESAMSILHSVQ